MAAEQFWTADMEAYLAKRGLPAKLTSQAEAHKARTWSRGTANWAACGKGWSASDVQLGAADPSQQYPKAWEFMISLKVGSSSRNLRRIRLIVARTFVRYP